MENINCWVVVSVDSIAFSFPQNYGPTIRQEIRTSPEAYAPYVFLIGEAKEVGDQGYEFLLRDHIEISYAPGPIQIDAAAE